MASNPIAAAERIAAPTLVWSTKSSKINTARAPSNTVPSSGRAGRSIAAIAPRCILNPVRRTICLSSATKIGMSLARSPRVSCKRSNQCSLVSTERGLCPAASAREITEKLSAKYRPCLASKLLRRFTSFNWVKSRTRGSDKSASGINTILV